MCNWFFICKCIGDYVLDFVLENVFEVLDWITGCICFLFLFVHLISFPFIPQLLFLKHFGDERS